MLVVGRQPLERDVGLPHQHPLRLVLLCDRLPRAEDVVHLGALAHVAHAVAQLAILDQPVRDVDAEAGDAAVEPVAEDLLELRANIVVPPVEIGLLRCELVQVVEPALRVVLPRGVAGEDRLPVVRDLGRPDVVLGTVGEPVVLVGGVVRHEVEPDVDPAGARAGDQRVEVVERPELGMHRAVVGDVVAPVDIRAREGRARPDRVNPEPVEVIEFRGQAWQIAHTVAVRVRKRARIDLIDEAAQG